MSNYIFDIETGPRSRAELAECVPTFEAPSNWKDSEKIRAYVAEKEAEWFQSAALSALASVSTGAAIPPAIPPPASS